MIEADTLGSNIVVDESPAPPAPPPPPESAPETPLFLMAHDEQFTREQYLAVGWTDEQLLAAGKMTPIHNSGTINLKAPIGMPEATWVILDDNDDIPPTGLFVGHNGTGYLIQAGVPVCVPNHVLSVLDDAVMDAPILDPSTRQVTGYRPRPRYTYRRVAAPADA